MKIPLIIPDNVGCPSPASLILNQDCFTSHPSKFSNIKAQASSVQNYGET